MDERFHCVSTSFDRPWCFWYLNHNINYFCILHFSVCIWRVCCCFGPPHETEVSSRKTSFSHCLRPHLPLCVSSSSSSWSVLILKIFIRVYPAHLLVLVLLYWSLCVLLVLFIHWSLYWLVYSSLLLVLVLFIWFYLLIVVTYRCHHTTSAVYHFVSAEYFTNSYQLLTISFIDSRIYSHSLIAHDAQKCNSKRPT